MKDEEVKVFNSLGRALELAKNYADGKGFYHYTQIEDAFKEFVEFHGNVMKFALQAQDSIEKASAALDKLNASAEVEKAKAALDQAAGSNEYVIDVVTGVLS